MAKIGVNSGFSSERVTDGVLGAHRCVAVDGVHIDVVGGIGRGVGRRGGKIQ